MKCILLAVCLLYVVVADEVRLVDLDPNEAANLIEKQDQSLKYAPLVQPNVPALRFIGNQQQQVVEDVYKANQYHGQDGLGAYVYGYSVPDIAKTEKKTRQGDVRGAYNYIAGDGQEIKIEYWDDGTGFHQIDNIPKVPLIQIEDTPEVKAAREEHDRLWKEIAERNSHPPQDPYANTKHQPQQAHYQGQATNQYNQPQAYQAPQQQFQAPHQPQAFQAQFQNQPKQTVPAPQAYQAPKPAFPQPNQQPFQAPPQPQSFQAQFPKPQSYQAPQPQQPQSFQAQFPSAPKPVPQPQPYQAPKPLQQPYQAPKPVQPLQYQAQATSFPQSQQAYNQPKPVNNYNAQGAKSEGEDDGSYRPEHAEESGPPKGFFYNFDYNVGIIKKPGEERSHAKRDNDPKSMFEQNKQFFEQNYGPNSQQQKGAFPSYNYQG